MTTDLPSQMHWSRWGDPAKTHPVSDTMRGLIEAFLGPLEDRPAVAPEEVRLPEVGLTDDQLAALPPVVGDEHVHTSEGWRLARTRGKSTPDLLKIRSGDGSDAPDAVVRPVDHDE